MFFRSGGRNEWRAGDAPPAGGYICAVCCSDYSMIEIRRKGQKLPLCPCCGADVWFRI